VRPIVSNAPERTMAWLTNRRTVWNPERRAGHRRVQRAPNTLEIEQQPLTG
jgi:hypothetical protein